MKKFITILFALSTLFLSACNQNDTIPILKPTPEVQTPQGRDIIFTDEQLKLPIKKGACFTLRDPATSNKGTYVQNMPKVAKLNVGWNYSWGSTYVQNQIKDIEFVPMLWGGNQNMDKFLSNMRLQIADGTVKRVLGFNEPDGVQQSNMSVEKALSLWPALESLGVPLGSPAVVNAETGQWLEDFMSEANRLGYRVNYICVHNYGGGSAQNFEEKLTNIYNKYHLPILVTEFAVADWNATSPETNKHSPEKVLDFMKTVLPWMEEQDFVLGYCWFSFNQTSSQGSSSALFDADGNLTELGKYYSEFPNITPDNPPVEEVNLLKNPGFEDLGEGWIKGANNVNFDNKITSPALADNIISGDITLRFSSKKSWANISQVVQVEKGHTYKYGFTGRIQDGIGPSGSTSTSHSLNLQLRKEGDKSTTFGDVLSVKTGTNTTVSGEITVDDSFPDTIELYISKANGIAYTDDVFFIDITK